MTEAEAALWVSSYRERIAEELIVHPVTEDQVSGDEPFDEGVLDFV